MSVNPKNKLNLAGRKKTPFPVNPSEFYWVTAVCIVAAAGLIGLLIMVIT